METTKPLILGLSHLYGEASRLKHAQADWMSHGFEVEADFKVEVPEEKQKALLPAISKEVHLVLLRNLNLPQLPALEFLNHGLELKLETKPRIEIFAHSPQIHEFEDADLNEVHLHPQIRGTLLLIRTQDPQKATDFFLKLGLTRQSLSTEEKELLKTSSTESLDFHHPLFPRLSFRMAFFKDPEIPATPRFDTIGLSGLSFLAPSLDALKGFHLKAPQEFERDQRKFRLAFSNESGVLVEFLESRRQ